MIIKEKENDMNHFNTAKKYFNSSPSDYINSLKELNQISFLIQNISVMHMKILCLLMLSKYEEIIECYYINKKYFDTLFEKVEENEEKNEIKKIIALAFYNFNGKQKAKQICPDIKDEYEHIIEKFEIVFLHNSNNINDKSNGPESFRINRKQTLKNIKQELDKNNKKSTQQELKKISSIFIDNLFDNIKEDNTKKNLILNANNNINDIEIIEDKKSFNSSGTNIYLKLKEEINNVDKIQKDDGNLITFEDKIKPITFAESSKENEKIEIQNKQPNDELKNLKEKQEEKKINNNNINNNNEINIYNNNNNNNNNNANSNSKENNKKINNLSKPRKSCNPLSFVNPIEFTLCPGDVSLSGSIINRESDEDNINSNNQKISVEVDGEQYIFVKNEKFINIDLNNNNNSENYEEYINIDFSGHRNKIKKKSSKLKYSKSVMINYDRKLEDFSKSAKDIKIDNQLRKNNYKKTSIFKTNYILDNK